MLGRRPFSAMAPFFSRHITSTASSAATPNQSSAAGPSKLFNPFTGRVVNASHDFVTTLTKCGLALAPNNNSRIEVTDAQKLATARLHRLGTVGRKIGQVLQGVPPLQRGEKLTDFLVTTYSTVDRKCDNALGWLQFDVDESISELVKTNDQLRVIELADQGYNIYVGGFAGTGKTVLLKTIAYRMREKGLVVALSATTGIAAVHLGGRTFHSMFGLGVSAAKWNMSHLRAVDVVIIDEISLLSSTILKQFDVAARKARVDSRPFGGIQVILCGDFLQLNSQDRPTLPLDTRTPAQQERYEYCFQSPLMHDHFIHLQLTQPLRHDSDDTLLRALRELRVGEFPHSLATRVETTSGAMQPPDPTLTYLFPRRADAARVNDQCLNTVSGKQHLVAPKRGALVTVGKFTSTFIVRFTSAQTAMSVQSSFFSLLNADMRFNGLFQPHDVAVFRHAKQRDSFVVRLRLQDGGASRLGSSTGTSDAAKKEWPTDADMESFIVQLPGAHLMSSGYTLSESDVPVTVLSHLADLTVSKATNTTVTLKEGCRVMVVRNLSKDVTNGSLGQLLRFEAPNRDLLPHDWLLRNNAPLKGLPSMVYKALPVVKLDSGGTFQIPPTTKVVGGSAELAYLGLEYAAIPLSLGYAFTVHKVQGLTLRGKVVYDGQNGFRCDHLLYVALSRVKSFDQLTIRNVTKRDVTVNKTAINFTRTLSRASDIVSGSVNSPGACHAAWRSCQEEQKVSEADQASDFQPQPESERSQ